MFNSKSHITDVLENLKEPTWKSEKTINLNKLHTIIIDIIDNTKMERSHSEYRDSIKSQIDDIFEKIDDWNLRSSIINTQKIIIINGRHVAIDKDMISYEQILEMLNFPITDIVTVTYRRGYKEKPEGIVVSGDAIRVKEGMIINATYTDGS